MNTKTGAESCWSFHAALSTHPKNDKVEIYDAMAKLSQAACKKSVIENVRVQPWPYCVRACRTALHSGRRAGTGIRSQRCHGPWKDALCMLFLHRRMAIAKARKNLSIFVVVCLIVRIVMLTAFCTPGTHFGTRCTPDTLQAHFGGVALHCTRECTFPHGVQICSFSAHDPASPGVIAAVWMVHYCTCSGVHKPRR